MRKRLHIAIVATLCALSVAAGIAMLRSHFKRDWLIYTLVRTGAGELNQYAILDVNRGTASLMLIYAKLPYVPDDTRWQYEQRLPSPLRQGIKLDFLGFGYDEWGRPKASRVYRIPLWFVFIAAAAYPVIAWMRRTKHMSKAGFSVIAKEDVDSPDQK